MSEERYFGAPVDPADRVCEFCDETASQVNVLVPFKLYVYTCDEHHEQGERSVATAPRKRGPKRSQDDRLFEDAA